MFDNVQKEDWFNGALEGDYDSIFIMQYTGLQDKNGKEIYEDDIVKSHGVLWRIIFTLGGWRLFCPNDEFVKALAFSKNKKKPEEKGFESSKEAYNMWWLKAEVVGNIYENPKLLDNGR